jgi:hypothetical protein
MKLTRLVAPLLSLALLSASASAQSAQITLQLQNGWFINTNFSTFNSSDFKTVYGQFAPDEQLNVNAFCTSGTGTAAVNRAQSNVQGSRWGNLPMTASAVASINTANMSFLKNGAPGTSTSTGVCTPMGVLPAQQDHNMSGFSQVQLQFGVFGTTIASSTTSKAEVKAPGVSGKVGSIYNRLILTQGPSLAPNFGPINGFYYSAKFDATATAALHVGDTAFFNTDVWCDALIRLQ